MPNYNVSSWKFVFISASIYEETAANNVFDWGAMQQYKLPCRYTEKKYIDFDYAA